MKTTETLHNAGQSLWLDNITRDLLTSGTLKRYIDTLSVTGLTSNPTIFDHAISKSAAYDEDIRAMMRSGIPHEDLLDVIHERVATPSITASFENPDHVAIVIHNYRWRLGLAEGEPKYDGLESGHHYA